MEEEWKVIEGYKNYSINIKGDVIKNKTRKYLKQRIDKRKNRSLVSIVDDDGKITNVYVSRLLAIAYIENEQNYKTVYLIDKNKSELDIKNLQWKDNKNFYNLTGEYGIGYTINNEEFYFDLEDYAIIKKHCWHIKKDGYAICTGKRSDKNIYMHRLIMGSKNDDNKYIDHINRIRNDNRKENLRIVTTQQNNFNQSIGKGNTSGIIGVAKRTTKTKKKGISEYWRSGIKYNGKHITKQFKTKEDAIKWRLQKELEYFGIDFAPQRNLFEKYGIK